MTKVIAKTYSMANEHTAKITKTFLVGCMIMAILYAYNMYKVVVRTVAAQNIESQAASLSASVQSLDARYIALSTKIDPSMAKDYGLHQGEVTAYINRDSSVGKANVVVSQL